MGYAWFIWSTAYNRNISALCVLCEKVLLLFAHINFFPVRSIVWRKLLRRNFLLSNHLRVAQKIQYRFFFCSFPNIKFYVYRCELHFAICSTRIEWERANINKPVMCIKYLELPPLHMYTLISIFIGLSVVRIVLSIVSNSSPFIHQLRRI